MYVSKASLPLNNLSVILHTLSDFVGLHSHDALEPVQQDSQYMLADSHEQYPIIDGIPILVDDPGSFLAESYVLLGKHLMTQHDLMREFSASFKKHPLRLGILQNVLTALEHNVQLLKPIADSIEPYFTKDQLLRSAVNDQSAKVEYLKALRYLKRDWSGLPESEAQVSTIMATLDEALSILNDRESCLVLGAGLGRIACELSDSFSRILAMDKSWSMAYLFKSLLEKNMLFYEFNYNNIARNIHATRLIRSGLPFVGRQDNRDEIRNKVSYFVSDVRKLPLADESVSCVLSVYFTDVIALEPYLSEVHRVLKKDGLFIHFGPLGYQFNAIENMLTAEEIKAFYYKLGYRHEMDRMVETTHMASHESLYNSTVNNWLFVTRKLTDSFTRQAASLSIDDIPELVSGIHYNIHGSVTMLGKQEHGHRITTSNGKTYSGSESFLDFVSLINGTRTFAHIFDTLSSQYDLTEENKTDLMKLTEQLMRDGVLQKKQNTK